MTKPVRVVDTIDKDLFIRVWNEALDRDEVARTLQLRDSRQVGKIAFELRERGFDLKLFRRGRRRDPVRKLKELNEQIGRARRTLSKLEAQRNKLMRGPFPKLHVVLPDGDSSDDPVGV